MTTIANTKKIIEFCVGLKSEDGVNIPSLLIGHQGVGKTQLVSQVADQLGYNLVVLNVANQTPEDLLGQIDGMGGYHRPKWLANEDDRPTIYFLDEFNRGQKYVLQCMFNFINEGRIHTHSTRSDDYVIAAINPDNEDFNVTCFDDHAMWSRFAHIQVRPTKDEFIHYLNQRVGNTVIQAAVSMSANLYTADKSIDHTYSPIPDNRNLEKIAFICDKVTDISDHISELIVAMIGFDAASVILEVWRQNRHRADPKKVLSSQKWPFKNDQIDEINCFIVSILDFTQKEDMTDQMFDGLISFIDWIPRDQCVKLLKGIAKANDDLFNKIIDTNIDKFGEMVEVIESE